MGSELLKYPPMLLDERPLDFHAPGWLWEIKFDGYRMMARFGMGKCELRSRNGADASKWFPELTRSLASVEGGPFITDGEVAVLDAIGRSNFDALQDRARRRKWYEGAPPVTYCVFDLIAAGRVEMIALPLVERKAALAEILLPAPPHVLLVGHFEEHADRLFHSAVHQLELEGLVAKRADSIYQPGCRSPDWVKVKRKGAIPAQRFRRQKQDR